MTAPPPSLRPEPLTKPERTTTRRFDLNWAIASFSSLIRSVKSGQETTADHDEETTSRETQSMVPLQAPPGAKLADDIRLFPRGAHAGNLIHRLFEILDYHPPDTSAWRACVATELSHCGFELKWSAPLIRLIENVLATPLPAMPTTFSLNQLDAQNCVKEMPFTFPLRPVEAGRLRKLFNRHNLPFADEDLDRQLSTLGFSLSGGYLRGVIDLVFKFQGRYFLLDWKSNHLGNSYADYDLERIRPVMTESFYFLQYHLYAVALDQFLRLRLPAYEYERDFGGVYYLFIRGIQPGGKAGHGIFFDRPESGLIEDLKNLMLAEGAMIPAGVV